MKIYIFIYLASFIVLTGTYTIAQTVEPKLDTFPASIAHAFHQDSKGFIWIGTQDGLLRFDGIDFKHYTNIPFDSTSLSNNWVFDIDEDKKGNLWLATFGGGLNYFDQRTEVFHRYAGSNQNKINYITKIIVNDDQSVWFTSTTHCLTHLKLGQNGTAEYQHFNFFEKSLTSSFQNSAMTIHKDKQGLLWIGMATEGLVRFNPQNGELKQFKNDPKDPQSISHNTIGAICEDDSGNIWIGTGHPNISRWGAGLNMYDRKKDKFRHFKVDFSGGNSICSNEILPLLIDKTGTLWLGSPNNYLNTVSLKDIIEHDKPVFRHHKNLYKPIILALYEDRQGNIWIGQLGMYFQKYDRQQNPFELFSRNDDYPNSLTSSGTWTVYADPYGKIWFGNSGLDVYDREKGSFRHYYYDENNPDGLSENMICGIQQDTKGQIWIATWHKGIDILNQVDQIFMHLRHDSQDTAGLKSNTMQYILNRADDGLWIASEGAVLQLYEPKKKKFHTFKINPKTNNDFIISCLFEDRNGILWIGTSGTGMYSLQLDEQLNAEIVHYQHKPNNRFGLCSDAITDIIQPAVVDTNSLWISTSVGLNRLDLTTGKFSYFSREEGLSTNFVLKILEDNQGNLWCATTNGLTEYNIKSGLFRKYGKGDGMPFTSFGAGRQCATKDKDGRLYFAGGNGVLSFQPEDIHGNSVIPPVIITDFKVFQQSVKLDTAIAFKKTIFLNYFQNIFSLQFAALNFTAPEKNQYAYKMDGFVDEWINIDNKRTVTFTNLDPGEYVFHVKGSNNHGVWNEEGTSLKVIIFPPWWRSWWAYLIYIFLIIFIVYSLIKEAKNRTRQKMIEKLLRERQGAQLREAELQAKASEARREAEKQHIRSRIASDLHDEIGSNLSSIALTSHILENKLQGPEKYKKRLFDLENLAIQSAEAVRDIVWFINPENDSFERLINKMRQTTAQMLTDIVYTFNVSDLKVIDGSINLDVRRNLFLIYKEILNNIIQHSAAKNVAINLTMPDEQFVIKVKDDGIGFDPQNQKGNGLHNYQMRARAMNGSVQVSSQLNYGTEIEIKVKIP